MVTSVGTILGWMLMLMCAAESTAAQTPEDTPEPSQHEFIVKNYKTESGAVLPPWMLDGVILCIVPVGPEAMMEHHNCS